MASGLAADGAAPQSVNGGERRAAGRDAISQRMMNLLDIHVRSDARAGQGH
jgi:hypothetical protein